VLVRALGHDCPLPVRPTSSSQGDDTPEESPWRVERGRPSRARPRAVASHHRLDMRRSRTTRTARHDLITRPSDASVVARDLPHDQRTEPAARAAGLRPGPHTRGAHPRSSPARRLLLPGRRRGPHRRLRAFPTHRHPRRSFSSPRPLRHAAGRCAPRTPWNRDGHASTRSPVAPGPAAERSTRCAAPDVVGSTVPATDLSTPDRSEPGWTPRPDWVTPTTGNRHTDDRGEHR
jgi:hypothetical protein